MITKKMKTLKRQVELQDCELHVREADEGLKSRTIEGHAIVFGVRSVNLTPRSPYREVYEVMERGCISTDLLNRSDVVLTAFHDNTAILGRWRQGKGTLGLQLDARGLRATCDLADTERANELLSAIQRKDISGMSFAFTADEDDSENGVSYEQLDERSADGKEVWIRHVKRVTGLYDVTIAGHPAYPQTDVGMREAEAFFDEKLGVALAQQQAEQAEQEEREKREQEEQAEREAKERAEREAAELKEKEERERMMAVAMQKRRSMRRKITENFIFF